MDKISIDRYISGAESLCREERQFALYLNNILLGIKAGKITGNDRETILTACGLDGAEIDDVFYEAAFMRDLFNNDKIQFNVRLLDYICSRKFKGVPDVETSRLEKMQEAVRNFHLGAGKGQEKLNEYPAVQFVTRVMMNAKPDIAVIYHKGTATKKYLLFIECKYLSKEDTYKYGITQTAVQNWIAEFLCEQVFNDVFLEKVGSAVKLVRFISPLNKKMEGLEGEGNITIKDLTELHGKIFSPCPIRR